MSNSKELAIVDLGSNMTIASVAELKESLTNSLVSNRVKLKVADLERVDTAGIQLLCSFLNRCRTECVEVFWLDSPSETFAESIKLLGLVEFMDIATQP